MKHLSEGTLRRMLDEPDEVTAEDKEHFDSCEECQTVNNTVIADVEVLTAMFGPELEVTDAEEALTRLNAVVSTKASTERASKAPKPAKQPKEPRPRKQKVTAEMPSGPRVLMRIGKTFVGLGTFILLFVAYQLIGTNFVTNNEQKSLAAALDAQWTSNVVEETPELGEGLAVIKIPKIGVDRVVVEGVEVPDLKKGPGHYPPSAMPGQLGNMVVSGHRTTYGAPFNRLDELDIGDEIVVYSAAGPFKYKVSEKKIVTPTTVEVLDQTNDARLTLTTCHPKFSAKERLIIVALLDGTPQGIAPGLIQQPGGIQVLPEA